jgi:hypothetical protein
MLPKGTAPNFSAQLGSSGTGHDLASLASADQADPWNLFMYASSGFTCSYVGTDPTTFSMWNGLDTLGTANTGIWTCVLSPSFGAYPVPFEPIRLIGLKGPQPAAATATAEYVTSWAGATLTVAFTTANDHTALTSGDAAAFTFYVMLIGPRGGLLFDNKKQAALDGSTLA